MATVQLTEQTRRRLIALIAEDRLDGDRLMSRLRQLRSLESVASCSALLHILAHLDLSEDEAEQLLEDLLRHREEVTSELGRDPGLRVAAVDYLSNVRKLLDNPTIVEMAELENTERSAVTDSLTDLYNRRYFESALEIEIRRSCRYALSMSLLMLDLDAFKPVNDLYGHPFGDLVLRRAGEILRRAVRESDVACRFGGEEFTVILPETDRLGAYALAERLRCAVETQFANKPVGGRAVTMTISGGIASYPEDGEDPQTLIARSDKALYLAKTMGRNRIVLFHLERRRSVRFPVRRSTKVWISAVPGAERTHVRAINLSREGALLSSGESGYRLAEAIELTVQGGGGDWVVPGKVVRIEKEAAPRGRHLLALAFDRPLPVECFDRQVARGRMPRSEPRSRL